MDVEQPKISLGNNQMESVTIQDSPERVGIKFPSQKKKAGRNIYGTITAPTSFDYHGSNEEMQRIVNYLSSTSKSYSFSVLGKELTEAGKIHYHYLVKYTTTVRKNVCEDMYKYFNTWSGSKCDRIIFSDNKISSVISYCIKDGNYVVHKSTDCIHDVEHILKSSGVVRKHKEVEEEKGYNVDNTTKKDFLIMCHLKSIMNEKGYKVNYHTRGLYGIDEDDFYEELKKQKFYELYGRYGIKLCKELIRDRAYHELPMWKPNISYVKFKDVMYNMSTGLRESINDDICPIIEYDYDIDELKQYNSILERYKQIVINNGVDLEKYRISYGRQFKERRLRGNMLYLYGVPLTGKTTLAIPFYEVNKNIIGVWANDNKFSMASIASFPRVYADEVCPFSMCFNRNEMKKLADGTAFRTKQKHGSPVEVLPKTGIFISNDIPPDYDDYTEKALKDRFDVYGFFARLNEPDLDFIEQIILASPLIMLWATEKI